jgi:hypothetical protein
MAPARLASPEGGKKFSDATLETLEAATGCCGQNGACTGCRVLKQTPYACRLGLSPRCRFAANGDIMDIDRAEALRKELGQLLRKQSEVLESRTFGAATDTDILEYEIRQEIIHEMCNQLANSDATA